jgi:hypothetical protein
MSGAYNDGTLETMYIDPVSFSQNRCAFELDENMAYSSNMRLLDFGIVSDGAHNYSRGLGALSIIKNIRLLDGRTELSSLRNPAQYLFFANCNRGNSNNKSNDSYLKRNELGFEIDGLSNKQKHIYNAGQVNTADNTTAKAYLNLREVLPLLRKLPVLSGEIFKSIRLEIEWDNNKANQLITNTNATVTITRPVLAVDAMNSREAVESATRGLIGEGLSWDEIEHDSYTIPAVNTAGFGATEVATQTSVNQSLALREKIVERILICKQLQDITPTGAGGGGVLGFGGIASSQANLDESFQVKLNGNPILNGFDGTVGVMESLANLTDEWGQINTWAGSNIYLYDQGATLLDNADLVSSGAWLGCRIGARVKNLQFQIKRTNNRDSNALCPTNSAQNVNIYAEVKKAIAFGKNGYNIVYA